MTPARPNLVSRRHVPQCDQAVHTAGGEPKAVRTESEGFDVELVHRELANELARDGITKNRDAIPVPDQQVVAIGTEGDADAMFVSLPVFIFVGNERSLRP